MTGPRLQHTSMLIPLGAQELVRAFYGGILGLEEKQPPHSLAHLNLVWFVAGEGEMELHSLPDPNPIHLMELISVTSSSWLMTWRITGAG